MIVDQLDGVIRLTIGEGSSDVFEMLLDISSGPPTVLHIGEPTGIDDLDSLTAMVGRPLNKAHLDIEAPASVCPEHGSGWQGQPGLSGRRSDNSDWSPRFNAGVVSQLMDNPDEPGITITCTDPQAQLTLITEIVGLNHSCRIRLRLQNDSETPYWVNDLAPTIPVPDRATDLQNFVGRWASEFQLCRREWLPGVTQINNRSGRTSHNAIPVLFTGTKNFDENSGEVWGFVLGWSGNSSAMAELGAAGLRTVRLGELLTNGDVILEQSETYTTPWVEVAYSSRGLNGISQALHSSIRSNKDYNAGSSPRPVTLNTWEAVYFDHDIAVLTELANRAKQVGVERFVLDDGWFHGRRSDNAGLGDWWVDGAVWPDGLEPLVRHVIGLGMEFGLWVEPEMVNPDSDLYRQHPDWALVDDRYDPVLGRSQLVLDLGLPEVRDYLYKQIDALLSALDIPYLKWDCNRDIVHGSRGTRPGMHDHMLGVYELIDRLKAAHPNVEIETCASGGARADFEILKRTDRVWTSDSNDALVRQRIQQGFSMMFPPEIMGAHIGPSVSHTSGRNLTLGFRAATAFFGHFGLEWDLRQATQAELGHLSEIIATHKAARPTLHGGTLWRLETSDEASVSNMVVNDDATEAFLSIAQLEAPANGVNGRIRLKGLDPDQRYSVSIVELGPKPGTEAVIQPTWYEKPIVATGQALQAVGLQPPLLFPESAIVIKLAAED